MTRIRVLLADDHAITREGTRRLLESEPDLEVVAEAGDGEEAVRLARALRPDVLVLDVSMPRMNGVEAAEAIRRELPDMRIVVLTGYDNEAYALALTRLGVQGYLSKTASSRELASALRSVQAGGTCYEPTVLGLVCSWPGEGEKEEPTTRELEVLRLVAEGLRNRDVARRLRVSERTVQFHLTNLFGKLGAASRTELVHLARQKGWLT